MNALKRIICWWLGHAYKPKDGTYTGTMLHVLINTSCVRCDEPFVDAFNKRRGKSS